MTDAGRPVESVIGDPDTVGGPYSHRALRTERGFSTDRVTPV